ncbi:MAG TPA: condensation domain-containing protein [Acidobacteriaceae bacterium]|nr:condensation domain-containing protein [Acidobacteriaceae bacterium]
MAELFAEVLHLQQVGIDDSFFNLGGDSISSIKLVSRARKAGISLTPKDIFRHQNVAQLASLPQISIKPSSIFLNSEPVIFPTTPIMSFYLEHDALSKQFNHAILFDTPPELSQNDLILITNSLVQKHDILRSRLLKPVSCGDIWNVEIAPSLTFSIESLLSIVEIDNPLSIDLHKLVTKEHLAAQMRLDPEAGIVMQILWIKTPAPHHGWILFTLHHLVIDGVSRSILLHDFDSAWKAIQLGEAISLESCGSSFFDWAEAISAEANTLHRESELPIWQNILGNDAVTLIEDNLDPILDTTKTALSVTSYLPEDVTIHLLRSVPEFFQCSMNDVLLASLALSLAKWRRRRMNIHVPVVIDVEGHGREDIFEGFDLTRTVGWFTTLFPIRLISCEDDDSCDTLTQQSVFNLIQSTKKQLLRIPDHGIGYGMLRYLNPDTAGQLAILSRPQLGFNYLGRFEGSSEAGLGATNLASTPLSGTGSDSPLVHEIELMAITRDLLAGPVFSVVCSWAGRLIQQEAIEELIVSWMNNLRMIAHCASNVRTHEPISCMPLQIGPEHGVQQIDRTATRTYHTLLGDHYIQTPEGRLPVSSHPLASAPEDMILRSISTLGAKLPVVHGARFMKHLDKNVLKKSFELLTARNEVLRTAYSLGESGPLQTIYAHSEVPIVWEDWKGLTEPARERRLAEVLDQCSLDGFIFGNPIVLRVFVGAIDSSTYQVVTSFNYCAIDGWSLNLVMSEWLAIYTALLERKELPPDTKPSYSEYISWLMKQDLRAARTFWRNELRDLQFSGRLMLGRNAVRSVIRSTCREFIVLDKELTINLRQLAQNVGCTESIVFQYVWGKLLSNFTGEKDVVFATAFTGRSVAFVDVDKMPGFTVNFLPVRMQIALDDTQSDSLLAMQEKQHKLIEFEFISLKKIRQWLNITEDQNIFESVLYFQNLGGILQREVGFFRAEMSYPLRVDIYPGSAEIGTSIHISYRLEEFGQEEIRHILGQYLDLLKAASDDKS